MKKVLLLLVVVFFTGSLTAQNGNGNNQNGVKIKPNSWAVSLNGGSSQFYGDIATNVYFYPWFPKEGELSYTAFGTAEKHFSPYYALRIRGGYSSYSSVEEGPNPQSIESTIWDIYLENKVSLSNILFPDIYQKKWSSYLLLGYGIPFYRTKLFDDQGNLIGFEGYSNNGNTKEARETAGSISVGLGFRLKLSQHFALSAEANIEGLNGDNLDATKHVLSEFDKYGYTSIGVVYTFGKNDKQVPMEYHPTPAEDLAMQEKLDSLAEVVNKLGEKVDGIDEKVDQLAERWNGPDSDNDGISDSYDKEADTEPGALVNHDGVTINDCCDKIDDLTTKPDVATGNTPNSKIAYESVYFALNSTYITPENMKKIANVAKIMNKNKDVKFRITGSACKIASNAYNQDLSKRRSEAVKKVLVENYGIDPNRLPIEYVGEEKPLAEEPLYINRRADFFMIK